MKKLIALLTAAVLVFSLSGCSMSKLYEKIYGKQDYDIYNNTEPVDTDLSDSEVVVTIPALIFKDMDMSTFDIQDYVRQNGFTKAAFKKDKSLAVRMTKQRQKEYLEELEASIDANFRLMENDPEMPFIAEVSHADDFSTVTMKVDGKSFDEKEDNNYITLGVTAMLYRAFLGEACEVAVSIVDKDTGDVLLFGRFPDEISW